MGVNKNATTNEITGKPGLPKPGYKRSTVPKPTAATANSGRIEANPGLGNDPVERQRGIVEKVLIAIASDLF